MTRNPKTLIRLGIGAFSASVLLLPGRAALAQDRTFSGIVSGGLGLVVVQPQAGTGIISGLVVDEQNAPMARVIVHAIGPPMPRPDGGPIEMSRSAPSDDSGRFRIDRLPPQSYVVAVLPMFSVRPQRIGAPPGTADDQPVYALTYYPGALDRAQAQPVAVTANGEQTLVIQLVRVRPVHIRGRVISPSGRSTGGVALNLARTIGSSGSSSGVGYVQQDGSFDITVPPGNYSLIANVSPGGSGGEFATTDIRPVDSDVNEVVLLLRTGGHVRGRMVFDGAGPGSAPLGAVMGLGPVFGTAIMGRSFNPVPVTEDWTFEASGLFGSYRFSTPQILLSKYRVVRTEFDGRDAGNTPVEIRDGDHQVVIHLAPIPPRPQR